MRKHRDDRPPGPHLDPFDPNNMPNHRDLGHDVPEDRTLSWILLGIIILVALLVI